jgi:hypothetical protein
MGSLLGLGQLLDGGRVQQLAVGAVVGPEADLAVLGVQLVEPLERDAVDVADPVVEKSPNSADTRPVVAAAMSGSA